LRLRVAGSLEGFSVSSELRATLRWAAARGEGDAWLAVAERDALEPVQAAAKVQPCSPLTSMREAPWHLSLDHDVFSGLRTPALLASAVCADDRELLVECALSELRSCTWFPRTARCPSVALTCTSFG
jgi:hypothetical protein